MVLQLIKEGESYRKIATELSLSKNTVMGIVHRSRTNEISAHS
jgi:DNA-binding NarL/FixJ family response regulator